MARYIRQDHSQGNIMLSTKSLAEIRSLTAINDHTRAYQVAATCLEEPELADQFTRIIRTQTELGHLPWDVYQERYTAYQALLAAARLKLDRTTYNLLYQST